MIHELRGIYRPLSNFWSCFIEYKGQIYPSVENAYQAAKMQFVEDRIKFLFCKASEAKQLGQVYPKKIGWEVFIPIPSQFDYNMFGTPGIEGIEAKIVEMYNLVKQKFAEPGYLQNLLLQTYPHEIQEGNWWGDRYWGTVNGKGNNWLGKILMQVRAELREELAKEIR